MKLMYKINLVSVCILIAVACAIATAGLIAISHVTYDLNREIMSKEVDNLVGKIRNAYDVLRENNVDGVKMYVCKAHEDLIEEFKTYTFGKTGKIMIVTHEGLVVLHDSLEPDTPIDLECFDDILRDQMGFIEYPYHGKNRFFSFKAFPEWNWMLILSLTSEEMLRVRTRFLQQVVFILLASLIIGSLIFIGFTGRLIKPIQHLVEATGLVSRGQWDVPLPEPIGNDEIAQLTAAFRDMATRLAGMYKNLRDNLLKVKQSQIALIESEEKYRELVELLPQVVFEIDTNGRLLFANTITIESFGYGRDELSLNFPLYNFLTSEDRLKANEYFRRIMQNEDLGMMEFTALRKDGSTFPSILLACAIQHEARIIGARGIILNITERKELENQLKRTQKFLHNIINTVGDPIFVKNEQRRFILVNNAFCKFVGYPSESLLEKTDEDFFPKEEANFFREKDDIVFLTGMPNENEETISDASGRKHLILTKRSAFRDVTNKNILVGIIKDITERKRMEQEMLKTQKIESVGILAGGIAHDFNNILTAVIGNLSLAKMYSEPGSKVYRKLEETEKASIRARDLTHQLLTFSRGGAPVKKTINLSNLIEESAIFALRGTNTRCEFDLPDNLFPVDADESQISQVINNLIINACQAMPMGGVIRVAAENIMIPTDQTLPLEPGKHIRITIRDEGTGIPEDFLLKIFDPYFTTKQEGSGLGLATGFSIINRHGGHITVNSKLGIGSVFNIYLPASKNEAFLPTKPSEKPMSGSGRILIMDDESAVRETVGEMLVQLGYDVDLACDGAETLSKYKDRMASDQPFDLVIMDLTIPGGMGGKQAIKELLTIDPNAKAVVSSGYSSDPVMADFSAYGFVGVAAKPFMLDELNRVIRNVLN